MPKGPKLTEVPTPIHVNDDLVESLERHLAAARSGELRSMAFAGVLVEGAALTEIKGMPGDSIFTLLGVAAVLKNRMLLSLGEGEFE